MAVKIAIIGGGSAYAPGVLNAFIHKADVFSGAEIALMDIALDELNIVTKLGQKMALAANVPIKITATTDQTQAISGADFVLSTFRQGGFEARHLDESIPLLYDVIGQETIGPGGFFFAMRTLPVIQSILIDIKEYAPGAVLINYTNPTQIVAEAVSHFSDVPFVSICDQSKADLENILHALNIPDAVVSLESVGLNHATWSTDFSINGEDGVEVMSRQLDSVLNRDDVDNRVKTQFRLANAFGRLPNSYLQYYYYREETLTEAKGKKQTRAQEILNTLPGYYQHFKDQTNQKNPQLKHVRGGSIFGDMAVEVMSSFLQNDKIIHTLNVPNLGTLPGFDPDRIVEVPAYIEDRQIVPIPQDIMPSATIGLLNMLAAYQWLAAEAIIQGDRKALEIALASNPLVLSLSKANQLLDHMLPLIKPFIPQSFFSRWG